MRAPKYIRTEFHNPGRNHNLPAHPGAGRSLDKALGSPEYTLRNVNKAYRLLNKEAKLDAVNVERRSILPNPTKHEASKISHS
jgi:hypothetical protein